MPSMDVYYRWSGWTSGAAVNINNVFLVDLNKDNTPDMVIDFWQSVPSGGMATDAPTPNRLVILESQTDGTYKDTTADRFGSANPVVLGGELGGVGVADFGDINKDGTIDMVFALNRDDGRAGTQTSGNSYPTAIMSLPNGQYEIQKISSPVWNYFVQLIDLGSTQQAWLSQIGYFTASRSYGSGVTGNVDGQPAYAYDAATKVWSVTAQPPVSGSFYVLPQQIKNGKVAQSLAMLWDNSTAFDPALALQGANFRISKPALMQQTASGDWLIQSVPKTYDFVPTSFTFNGNKATGMVALDSSGYFSLIEYFYRPGHFELYPGSAPVVMATRSMALLDKNPTTGELTGTTTANKMDFFAVGESTLEKLAIQIVDEQTDLASWSFRYLDFNKDGLTDILVEGWHSSLGPQDASSGAPAIYLNTGAGIFVHLSEALFPKAPEGWSRYSMSQVVDANGDDIYDLLYFPAIANGQFIANLDWPLFLGTTNEMSGIYQAPITINDRIRSSMIKTQAGNDVIKDSNTAVSTQIDAGLGIDTAHYSGPRANYQISPRSNAWLVSSSKTEKLSDTLINLERLQFSDVKLALDLDSNAGHVAKTLGAVFGKAALSNQAYVGVGLHFVDDLNCSYSDLMQLAISARLGATHTNSEVVDLLYTNVVGTPPDEATRASFVQLLENHTVTVASLGMMAAETDLNKANIQLTGLQTTGLLYTDFISA